MKVAYVDASSGIAGDMTIAALSDAGAPLSSISELYEKIELRGLSVTTQGTIVVPPSQVAEGLNPPQENKPAGDDDAHHAEERKRRSILHGWY